MCLKLLYICFIDNSFIYFNTYKKCEVDIIEFNLCEIKFIKLHLKFNSFLNFILFYSDYGFLDFFFFVDGSQLFLITSFV